MIQISLIDTWAATAGGALGLAENSLYTTDVWEVFFDKLAPNGVLSVSRWHLRPRPLESYRLVSLAATVLREAGVERPRDNMRHRHKKLNRNRTRIPPRCSICALDTARR